MEAHFKKATKSSLMLKSASTKRKMSVHQQAEESALQQQVLLTTWLYPRFAASTFKTTRGCTVQDMLEWRDFFIVRISTFRS